jgi:multidrug efflux pump subunit AcrA (membrane-fusion protein)
MPGMFARIKIVLEKDDNAQVVPSKALVDRNGTNIIFVVGDSLKARSVPVTVGINDGNYAQILSPTEIKEPVVTLGQHLLKDGSVVKISNLDPKNNDKPDSKK